MANEKNNTLDQPSVTQEAPKKSEKKQSKTSPQFHLKMQFN